MALLDTLAVGSLLGTFFLGSLFYLMFIGVFFLAFYIYFAIALMTIAKKTNTEPAWLAWIPIANLYLIVKIARAPMWSLFLVLLVFIPIIGQLAMIGLMIWWFWKISEIRGRPGWFGVLMIVPILNLIILGVLAWGESININLETTQRPPMQNPPSNRQNTQQQNTSNRRNY